MKIGIISDTHDHLARTRNAVTIFNEHKVDCVLHAGDYVSPFSINPLLTLQCEWSGVFGNNDGDREYLKTKSQGRIKEGPLFLDLDSRKIAVMHSFQSVPADIIICGHTHKPEIRHDGTTLIINPGEACGWITTQSSIVILDLETMHPDLIYF